LADAFAMAGAFALDGVFAFDGAFDLAGAFACLPFWAGRVLPCRVPILPSLSPSSSVRKPPRMKTAETAPFFERVKCFYPGARQTHSPAQ